MNTINLLGTMAAVLTTSSFLWQVIKSHRMKETKDISLLMYSIFSVGIAVWTIYGFMIGSAPIVIANVITLTLSLYILFLKLRYG